MNGDAHQRVHRLLHHSIVQPAQRLVKRCQDNVLVSRRGSDVTIAAGALCSACHHLPEAVAPIDDALATKIAAWPLFDQLRDISDTHKHGTLRKPDRQMDLTANLTFVFVGPEVSQIEGMLFGFRRTEIHAASPLFPETEVIPLIYDFAGHCAGLLGDTVAMPNLDARSIMTGQPIVRTDAATISFEDFAISFYRHRNGMPAVRDHPGPCTLQLVNLANLPIGQISLQV